MKANLKFARSTAAAFGLIALGLAPAFAADAVMDEPPAPAPSLPVASWAGPYAGLALGYGFAGQTELRDPALEIDTDGFLINGFAGYQLENNGFVYASKVTPALVVTKAPRMASNPKAPSMGRFEPASVWL